MSTQEPPRINPARLLREYILMHFSRDELVPDFEQQMAELEAYLNEPVAACEDMQIATKSIHDGEEIKRLYRLP